MKIVLQPHGSNLCGQACIAMAIGIALKTSIKHGFNGHIGKTSWPQIRWALYRFKGKSSLQLFRGTPTKKAIARMRFSDNSKSHFVIFDGTRWFDPERGIFETDRADFLLQGKARISTYVLIG